jgi:hypothetical protein
MSKAEPKEKGQTGRRRFSPQKNVLDKIFQLAQRGCTNEEIFKAVGIAKDLFYREMKKKGALYEAVIKGRDRSIEEVENALFKIAVGFFQEEVSTVIKDVDGKQTKEVKKVKKHYPPNAAAICFILKNRKNDKWNDRKEIEHAGTIDHTHTATQIIFQDIKKAVDKIIEDETENLEIEEEIIESYEE